MKRIILFLSIVLAYTISGAQINIEWAFGAGTSNLQDYNEDEIQHVTDSDENIYITSIYPTTIDLDPSGGTYNLTSGGGQQSFVAKYDKDGNLIWAKNIPETSTCLVRAIAVDNYGNVIVSGSFNQVVDMDPSAGSSTLSPFGTDGQSFLAKYDTDGNLIWAKAHNSTGLALSHTLAVDANNNIYEAGYITDSIDLDFSLADASVTAWGGVFLARYDEDGGFIWGGLIDSLYASYSDDFQLLIDQNDLFIKTKQYWPIDADIFPGTHYNIAGQSTYDQLVLKYNLDGEIQWGFNFGGPGTDDNGFLAVDDNNVYVVGNFLGTVLDIDPQNNSVYLGSINGVSNLFLASYARQDYQFNWAKRIVSSTDVSRTFGIHEIGNNILVGGTFKGDADFDPSGGTYSLSTTGFYEDVFLASYAKNSGNFEWVETSQDYPFFPKNFTYNKNSRRIVLSGAFNLTPDMSFSTTPYNITSNGNLDMFVSSYSDVVSSTNENESQLQVLVYPNPTENVIYVNTSSDEEFSVSIFNLSGALCYSGSFVSFAEIDLSQMATGTYQMKIQGATGVETQLILKSN